MSGSSSATRRPPGKSPSAIPSRRPRTGSGPSSSLAGKGAAPGAEAPAGQLALGHSKPATKDRLVQFFEHLEEELDRSGFMRDPEKRPSMVRNLRNLFQRAQCTEQELRTLHGVVTSFAGPRKRKKKAEDS